MEQIILPFDKQTPNSCLDMKGFRCSYTVPHFSGLMPISEHNEIPRNYADVIGIYYLYSKEKELLYIGKSETSIYSRVVAHLYPNNPYSLSTQEWSVVKSLHYSYYAYSILPKNEIYNAELLLINHFHPKFNISDNTCHTSWEKTKCILRFYKKYKDSKIVQELILSRDKIKKSGASYTVYADFIDEKHVSDYLNYPEGHNLRLMAEYYCKLAIN